MEVMIKGETLENDIVQKCIYNDYSGGRADSLELVINDSDYVWRNSGLKKGVAISSTSDLVSTGEMFISSIGYENKKCILKALSTPPEALNQKSYIRRKITTEELIKEVANELNLQSKLFEITSYTYDTIERTQETATSFLNRILELEGYLLKIFDRSLIVYPEKVFENNVPVIDITEDDFVHSPTFSTSDGKIVSSVENRYMDSELIYTKVESGLPGMSIKKNIPVSSMIESERFCRNILRMYNKNEYVGSGKVSNQAINAGDVINLVGSYGLFGGSNFVFKVTHNMLKDTSAIYFRKPLEGDY
mgnify:CR=1 FL=1